MVNVGLDARSGSALYIRRTPGRSTELHRRSGRYFHFVPGQDLSDKNLFWLYLYPNQTNMILVCRSPCRARSSFDLDIPYTLVSPQVGRSVVA
jgi:hypothetical protein